MPFVMFFFYMLAEIFTFWAVASLIGFGWALIALFGTVVLGVIITRSEIRRIATTQASLVQRLHAQRHTVTDDAQNMSAYGQNRKSAGDIGLTLAGALLLSIPGFATAILGLLLVFPLTRPIIRGFLLGRMYRRVEKLGVRFSKRRPLLENTLATVASVFPWELLLAPAINSQLLPPAAHRLATMMCLMKMNFANGQSQ
ncbi:FxsA family protein [Corynebacterium pseudodiphtheriticum]|uniref:FxsA family protein n=1 Tax=Corynebacterium pseudodiphtheriticum TaxID=37637 RepID=UPI00254DD5EE|nr:FxsA family protein [Corynebacterium pseudodiphtheriticum]MDK8544759.1 FxsA family protein [Corynebacterium pseudodiphtheriticum]